MLVFVIPVNIWHSLLITSIVLSGVIYIYAAYQKLKEYQKDKPLLDLINLRWLKNLTISMGVVWLCMIGVLALAHFSTTIIQLIHQLTFVLVSCFVFIIGFLGLKNGAVFSSLPFEKNMTNNRRKKYAQSGLKPSEMEALEKRLQHLMETEEPFTDPDLSLNILAHQMQVSPHYISQILNLRLQTKFYDFINGYRVEKAKKLIADTDLEYLSLMGIAYKCGFNSKSTFNRAFKKLVGHTPSQFKKIVMK